MLPELSVAVQVTVVVPRGKQLPDAGEQTTGLGGSGQLSVAVGVGKVTTTQLLPGPVVFVVIEAGQVIAGGWVSFTVTGEAQLDSLFNESLAVQMTVVVPFWNVEPDGGEHIGVTGPSQLSVAVTV